MTVKWTDPVTGEAAATAEPELVNERGTGARRKGVVAGTVAAVGAAGAAVTAVLLRRRQKQKARKAWLPAFLQR